MIPAHPGQTRISGLTLGGYPVALFVGHLHFLPEKNKLMLLLRPARKGKREMVVPPFFPLWELAELLFPL